MREREAAQRALESADRANRAKSRFLATAASIIESAIHARDIARGVGARRRCAAKRGSDSGCAMPIAPVVQVNDQVQSMVGSPTPVGDGTERYHAGPLGKEAGRLSVLRTESHAHERSGSAVRAGEKM